MKSPIVEVAPAQNVKRGDGMLWLDLVIGTFGDRYHIVQV